jgi:hypothetical protein
MSLVGRGVVAMIACGLRPSLRPRSACDQASGSSAEKRSDIAPLAATQAEAERKLRTVLETSDANLGFLDNAPIVVPVAIEGDLDLVDAQEAPRPQHGSRRRRAPANEPR